MSLLTIETPPKKHAGGRPPESLEKKLSKYTITLKTIEKLYKLGCTDEQAADIIGIKKNQILEWKKLHKEIGVPQKDWKLEADVKVEQALYARACGYRTKCLKNYVVSDGRDAGSHLESREEEVVFAPDATSMIFWLKNRQPDKWRDTQEVKMRHYLHDDHAEKSVEDLQRESILLADKIIADRGRTQVPTQN